MSRRRPKARGVNAPRRASMLVPRLEGSAPRSRSEASATVATSQPLCFVTQARRASAAIRSRWVTHVNNTSRRDFVTVLLTSLLALRTGPAWPETAPRHTAYVVDVKILYGALTLHLDGMLTESVDRPAGRYTVTIVGEGNGIANRIESKGLLRDRRWTPVEAHSLFDVRGRESRSDIVYDWTRRTISYRFRGETFFLRRLRVADDVVAVPDHLHVDDAVSAMLNYADGLWPTQPDGTFETFVVRRKRPENESPDDVRGMYRAELVPLTLRVAPDSSSGRPSGSFDLSRFSSWARRDEPARIVFGHDRRPESLALDMILGTAVKIEMRSPEWRRQGLSR
jgi:hypothetical protein